MEYVTAFIILCLAAIAARIAVGLARRRLNMWKWIILYWIVLTVKNVLDFAGGFLNGF